MSNSTDVKLALIKAAEAVAKRPLSSIEKNNLVRFFNKATGSYFERAIRAIELATNISQEHFLSLKESSATANTDRVMQDLENTLDNWVVDKND